VYPFVSPYACIDHKELRLAADAAPAGARPRAMTSLHAFAKVISLDQALVLLKLAKC
jgi:hypothetical protein